MSTPLVLSPRESEVLAHVGRFRFLTRKQVERFLFGTNSATMPLSRQVMAKRVLRSLAVKGLVRHTARATGGTGGGSAASAYFLTRAGVRVVADSGSVLPSRAVPKGTFLLRHALTTAEVALAFAEAAERNRGHAVVAFDCDWQAAQRVNGYVLVPDAYLVYATDYVELHAFLEIDLGTAGSTFFRRKIERYLELYRSDRWRKTLGVWPSVRVIAPSEQRTALLKRVTETVLSAQTDSGKLRSATEFAFASLPRLVEQSPLAAIWNVAHHPGTHAFLPHP